MASGALDARPRFDDKGSPRRDTRLRLVGLNFAARPHRRRHEPARPRQVYRMAADHLSRADLILRKGPLSSGPAAGAQKASNPLPYHERGIAGHGQE
jgi:hypothetical protein